MPDAGSWNPGKLAVWHQRWGELNDSCPTAVMLRHPTVPYVDTIDDDIGDAEIEKRLKTVALEYLFRAGNETILDPPLRLPKPWLHALSQEDDERFWWLPILWPSSIWPSGPAHDAKADAFVSYEVRRGRPDVPIAPPIDRTVILLASEWVNSPKSSPPQPMYLGSEFGICVIMHVRRRPEDSKFEVRITGMSASLPFGRYLTHGYSTSPSSDRADNLIERVFGKQDDIKTAIAKLVGLEKENIKFRGVRVAEVAEIINSTADLDIEWRCTSKADASAGRRHPISYSLVFRGTNEQPGALINKVELVADADIPGRARVFPIEPASYRELTQPPSHQEPAQPDSYREPTQPSSHTQLHQRRASRSEKDLDREREYEKITNRKRDPLRYPLSSSDDVMELPDSLMEVVTCPGFVLEDDCAAPVQAHGDSSAHVYVKVVDLPGSPERPPIRSNDFAAISAYKNVRQLFQRLEAYGLAAADYFRMARPHLNVFYRSGIPPGRGKDGQTVNARVRVEGWPEDLVARPQPKKQPRGRPVVEMHLALANLSTRARKPWNDTDRSPAEPLGIAADARWIWHEIGHVLLMASVGELVFRFCHSAGDALAAIVADPQSNLATDPKWRGATFPWVFTPRRHDRCVAHGWSWGGTMHYDMAQVPMSQAPRTKGYWTEQILSSSLFRLYRCMGGDTVDPRTAKPDRVARESASHYATYLIMRGIQELGPTDVVPAYEPDQLVSALIHADVGTENWDVSFPPPPDAPEFKFCRVGGCVHKVIRWAFEAQGLYNPFGEITNAPGSPPPVDIYIESNRPSSDDFDCGIDYGPGSYAPVSLDWDPGQSESQVLPWQAKPEAIVVTGDKIHVKVGNRGNHDAAGVTVRVWWHEWHEGDPPPKWKGAGWNECESPANQSYDVAKRDTTDLGPTFGPFTHTPPAGRYIILAQATCKDDRANIDPATCLPCSRLSTELVDLVANDNNLGLRVVNPPG